MSDRKQILMAGLTAMELGANILLPRRDFEEQFAAFQQERLQRQMQEMSEAQQALRSMPPAEIRSIDR